MGHSDQPTALFITRLVVTAVLAYLIALWLLAEPAPVLAPLTALLVVQVSLFQTLRSAVQRIISVTAGVILAVFLVGWLGFTWWSLGVTIAVALLLGRMLRLGDNLLEVPISAMLILQLGSDTAAAERVKETLIGAGVGLLAGLLAAPVRVRPAQEAVDELGRSMQDLLDRMAEGLRAEPDDRTTADWMERSRRLTDDIQEVDQALTEAEESARLNPRTRIGVTPGPGPALRSAMQHLAHSVLGIHALARSMADRTGLLMRDRTGLGAEMWEADVRTRLAVVLRELATATRLYTRAATTSSADDAVRLVTALESRLSQARRCRDDLGRLLREDPGHWPLHGELLVHLDRLIDELRAAGQGPVTQRPGRRRRPIARGARRRVRTRIPILPGAMAERRRNVPSERPPSPQRTSLPEQPTPSERAAPSERGGP